MTDQSIRAEEGQKTRGLTTVDPLMALYLDMKALAETSEARAASAEAEVERLKPKVMPHMCRDDHPEIRHAVSDDDERCPVYRERDRAWAAEASASALRDRVAVLESALRSLEESLRPAEHVPFVDPVHGAAVEALGHRIGFGALMSSASASWAAFLEAIGTPGGEFVSGPCRAVLQADLRAARAALKESPYAGH